MKKNLNIHFIYDSFYHILYKNVATTFNVSYLLKPNACARSCFLNKLLVYQRSLFHIEEYGEQVRLYLHSHHHSQFDNRYLVVLAMTRVWF